MVAKITRFRKKKESSFTKKLFLWSFFAVIGLLGLFLIFYNLRLYQKRAELQEKAKELTQEIMDLQLREQELRHELETSNTEGYQERVLREQGLYQKPGEEVITVLPPDEPETKEQRERAWWNPWTWFK